MDPSRLPTCPQAGGYDGGPSSLDVFQFSTPGGKTAVVYDDNHSDTAADAALRVPGLARQNASLRPTFIPALTVAIQHANLRGTAYYQQTLALVEA